MPASYHRRINYDPRDVEAVALCQLGSGSSLMGYYMYHGGQNPEGKLTTLQESQATGYPNDLPVKNYDFNAPIGEYGQLNPQYFWLRRLHLFLHDFGDSLATMPLALPENGPTNKSDLETLCWSVRSDGHSGYVFVNNYQRLQPMPAKKGVQFKLALPSGEVIFPQKPVTIPADAFFFWPFNLDLGGAKLIYATAQPVCRSGDTFYFAEIPRVKAEFVFDTNSIPSSKAEFHNVKAARKPAFSVKNKAGEEIQIVLLSEADSLALQKAADGHVFEPKSKPHTATVKTQFLFPAGPAREIPLGAKTHLAIAPTDLDFDTAAVWKLTLPPNLDLNSNPILRIRYVGDVARLRLNGKMIEDDFYSGRDFEIGLKRYGPDILNGDLRVRILPLRSDAPIYFEPRVKAKLGKGETSLKLISAEIVNFDGVELHK